MNLPFIHPSDGALCEFASGDLSASNQKSVASHLERCQRCRDRVAFRRDLRVATSGLPHVEPPSDLLQRILNDRSAGERAILPTGERASSRSATRPLTIAAIAAALVILALGVTVQRRSATVPAFVSATVFFPEVASAGETGGSRSDLPPVGPQIDASRLRLSEVEYQRYTTDSSGKRTISGGGTTTVRRGDVNGAPALRVERRWATAATATEKESKEIDSMLLDGRDLHLLERYVEAVPYSNKYSRITVTQKFNGDSVYGRMTSEGGDSRGVGRTFLRRLPHAWGPYTTDAFAPLFFTTLPMTLGWHGRVSVLGWAVRDTDVFYPVDIRVVGREPITVPAGSFDCWRLVITYGTRGHDVWVRTSDGLTVRVRNVRQSPSPSVTDIVLLNAK